MAQDFFAAFGHDGLGQIGRHDDQLRRHSGDSYDCCAGAGEADSGVKQKEARIAVLESRLEALELRNNQSIQITAGKGIAFVATGE